MKKLIITVTLCLLTFFAYSQEASVTEGCSPLTINFTPPSGSTSFYWSFGDGTISTNSNPSHIYVEPGNFIIEFRESMDGSVIGNISIIVYPKPDLNITVDPSAGCTPLDVQFSNGSIIDANIQIVNYNWFFGDGQFLNSATPPNHTYTGIGTFSASLELTTNFESCNVTKIFSDIITVSDTNASFTTNPSPASACEPPLEVTFINTSINDEPVTYLWDFGNSNTSTDENPTVQTYTASGEYTVILTVTNNLGCSSSATQTVSIGTPNVNFDIPDTLCVNQWTEAINLSSSGIYSWSFGAGGIPFVSNQENPFFKYTTTGPKTISLTVTSPDGSCSFTFEKEVLVIGVEDSDFAFAPDYSCDESFDVAFNCDITGVSYTWNFGDGSSSTDQNPTHTFNAIKLDSFVLNSQHFFNVTLTLTNDFGCSSSKTYAIESWRPTAQYNISVSQGCIPLTVDFTDNSSSNEDIVSWVWEYGDGTIETFNTPTSPSHTYTAIDTFYPHLIITNTLGCMDTSFAKPIQTGDILDEIFTVENDTVCPGTPLMINYTPSEEVDFYVFNTEIAPFPLGDTITSLDIILEVNYNGCISESQEPVEITILRAALPGYNYEIDCENPFRVFLHNYTLYADSILWDFGDGTTSTNFDLTNHTYSNYGTYTITLTGYNYIDGCGPNSKSYTISIVPIVAEIQLDDRLCKGQSYILDASNSQGVWEDCWRGYDWHFENDRPIATSLDSIDYSFNDSGPQTLTLITTNINGCRDTTSKIITIYGAEPQITLDKNIICFPSDVLISDISTADTTIIEWNWQFGDGSTSMDSGPFNHTYTWGNDDAINVFLTFTDAIGCEHTALQNIEVYHPSSLVTTEPNPNICIGDMINFTATDFTDMGSFLSFDWDFQDGQTSSIQNPMITFNTSGLLDVELIIEEQSTGCKDTIITTVDVQDYPTALFSSSLDTLDIICYPQNAVFLDQSISSSNLTYDWIFDNGQFSDLSNPGTFYGKGTYEVTFIATTTNSCADTITKTYELVGPEGDFTMDNNQICKHGDITFNLIDTVDVSSFSWDFGDGFVVDDVNPTTHTYNLVSTFATLILKGQNDACTFPVQKPITIIDILADFTTEDNSFEECLNVPITFINQTGFGNQFNWDFGNNATSNEENPIYVFPQAGNYGITLISTFNPLGCVDTIVKNILVHGLPTPNAISDTICANSNAYPYIFNSNIGSNYNWTPNGNFILNNEADAETVPLSNDITLYVQETDINNCVGTDSIHIVVVPTIESNTLDTAICPGIETTLETSDSPYYQWVWTPADNLSCSNCPTPVVLTSENIQVTGTGTDIFGIGCPVVEFNYSIIVPDGSVTLPNIFSPNGDSVNDYFNIITDDSISEFVNVDEFRIYDRWGNRVYNNDTPTTGWDGKFKGTDVPPGVYVSIIKASIEGCPIGEIVADITIIR